MKKKMYSNFFAGNGVACVYRRARIQSHLWLAQTLLLLLADRVLGNYETSMLEK